MSYLLTNFLYGSLAISFGSKDFISICRSFGNAIPAAETYPDVSAVDHQELYRPQNED